MNIFFVLFRPINYAIYNKVNSQVKYIKPNYNSNLTLFGFCDNQFTKKNRIILGNISKPFLIIINYLYRHIQLIYFFGKLNSNTIIYIRGEDITLFFYIISSLLKKIRKYYLLSEHQTMELKQVLISKNYLFIIHELFFGKLIRNHCDAIIGVTEEITEYEISFTKNQKMPHITIGNGIDVSNTIVRKLPIFNKKVIHLICVARVSQWHGLDRLLYGISLSKNKCHVIFHIVGDGDAINSLHRLVNELNISNYVIFHGFLKGKTLDSIFNECHVAVASLGIHRKGLTETSELKIREYCSRGIPFITSCTDSDIPDNFPYILKIPGDESPVNVDDIINFAESVYQINNHPDIMRTYAVNNLDWSVKMNQLSNFIKTLYRENTY